MQPLICSFAVLYAPPVLKFSRRLGRRRPPLPLIRSSVDNLGERAHRLHIIDSASSTTGFICWRRATFDPASLAARISIESGAGLCSPLAGGEWEEGRGDGPLMKFRLWRCERLAEHLRSFAVPLTSVARSKNKTKKKPERERGKNPGGEAAMSRRPVNAQ